MTMLNDFPRISSTSPAFRKVRGRLLVDVDNTGTFDGQYDDWTAGIAQTVVLNRGTDNESQASGTILSGSFSTALYSVDKVTEQPTHAFNPNNPNSPLFGKNLQGVKCQYQYVDNTPRTVDGTLVTQTVIPLWTGRILDVTPQSGTVPLVMVNAIGVLGWINTQEVTLPPNTFAQTTKHLSLIHI